MKQIPNVHELKNILICRGEGSLGDAVLSSCCYREIKKANPQIKITVACFGPSYPYFQNNAYVDEVVKLPVRTLIRPNQRWLSLIGAALKLRRKHFDLVLDSSRKKFWNWRLFKWIAGGDKVLDCFTSPVQPFGALAEHASQHEQAILKLLGIEHPDASYDLPVPPQTQSQVDSWLTGTHIQSYILLNPSGSISARRFSKETLHTLVKSLTGLNRPFVVPTVPAQRAMWAEVFADLPQVHVKQTADIFELFELVRRAELVVTPDTSVVHLATGYHRPTLGVYNRFSKYNAPLNPKAVILRTAPETVNKFSLEQLQEAVEQVKKML